nr:MAG TPA: hypothetical protein [Caudoviricetes sp.]
MCLVFCGTPHIDRSVNTSRSEYFYIIYKKLSFFKCY